MSTRRTNFGVFVVQAPTLTDKLKYAVPEMYFYSSRTPRSLRVSFYWLTCILYRRQNSCWIIFGWVCVYVPAYCMCSLFMQYLECKMLGTRLISPWSSLRVSVEGEGGIFLVQFVRRHLGFYRSNNESMAGSEVPPDIPICENSYYIRRSMPLKD